MRNPWPGVPALALLLHALPSDAQVLDQPPTGYGPLPYENRFDDGQDAGVSAGLKNLPLDRDGDWRVDLGGSLRERVESLRNPLFGIEAAGGRPRDTYLLHRLLLNADVRRGGSLRVYLQLANELQTGRSPAPLPTDESRGDLAQGFVEANIPAGSTTVGVRAGRQEMAYGANRLVDIREGPNIRQRFDGVRGWMRRGEARIDAFWTRPVDNRPGWLDDRSARGQQFYGVYGTVPIVPSGTLSLDAYYLRLDRRQARLDAGSGRDRRDTLGVRASGRAGRMDYDVEGAIQRGDFAGRAIRAWAVFSDTGYSFEGAWRPRLGIKANVASGGDGRGTGALSTFYPLFPKNNEFNEANIQTFVNYMDVYPYLKVQPRPDLGFMIGADTQWRQSRRDGFYQPPGLPILPASAGRSRFLGTAFNAQIEWQATTNINLNVSAVRYAARGFLREAGAEDTTWVGAWGTFNF